MSISTYTPFTESELDEILALNQEAIHQATETVVTKLPLPLTLPEALLTTLSTTLNIPLSNPVPGQVVKGNTTFHLQGTIAFSSVNLLYLTSTVGDLYLANYIYPIQKGLLITFPSSIDYGTIQTQDTIRVCIGPFNERGEYVEVAGF